MSLLIVFSEGNRSGFLIALFANIVGFVMGRSVFTFGKRLAQEPASARLKMDRRPPVFLLRAFSIDGKVAETNWFAQRSLFGWLFGRASFEEQLATVMENLGPTVTLGSTGEVLPKYGFSRQYATNSSWRKTVDDYLSSSSWVVILLQELTPNVIYEIQRSLSCATSTSSLKVLLIPPPLRFRTTAWQRDWLSLRADHPLLPPITDLTAAVLIDPREGTLHVPMLTSHSANAQLLAIHGALIPKYLISSVGGPR